MGGGKAIGDDWVNIAFQPKGNVVVTADRDVYRYDPKEKIWKSKEGNLQVTLFYDVTPDPKNVDVAYGVAQDHPRAMKFTGSIEWAYMPAGGETGKVLVDPGNTSILYVSNPLDPANFVARSTDAGVTWKVIFVASDFVANDYSLAYSVQRSFAMDPKNSARLLIGTTKVWETKNATAASPTWSAVSGILGGPNVAQQYITALAIAPSAPQTVYAATSDGHVWATTNGGSNWAARDTGLFGMGAGKVVDIRIDPKNPDHAFAVGAGAGSVWHLTKSGSSLQWKNVSGNLPSYLRFATIFVDWSIATPALYVGTTRGVYQSVNLGVGWSVFGLDMPHTVVSGLESVTQNVLVASTIGRGAWAILLKAAKIIGKVFKVALPREGGPHGPGDPIEGVRLILDSGGGDIDQMPTALTDASGRYHFDGVPPGTYTLRRIVPPGHVAIGGEAERIVVHGSDIDDLDFRYLLSPGHGSDTRQYEWTADLAVLPGRQFGEAIGGRSKREKG